MMDPRASRAQRKGLQGAHNDAEDATQQQHHPLVLLEDGVQHALEALRVEPREPEGEGVPEGEGLVHVGRDLLGVIRQLRHCLPDHLVLDAFDGSPADEDGRDDLRAAQRLVQDALDGGVHVPLEDLQDLVHRLGPPNDVLQHLPGVDEVGADHGGHLLRDLLLPLEEDALDVDVAPADDVGLDGAEDHGDAEPIREVTDDQARHREDHEAAPAPEAALGVRGRAVHAAALVQQEPQEHLQDAEDEAHDGGDVLDEDELSRADVLEHLHQQLPVLHKHVYGHLLDVDDLVHVGLEVLDDRLEHLPALLNGLLLELALHRIG
mmetsp:Transcript_22396/g.69419  ORF Transcript_22396/g.69419 Transcript_22396/m.69419 type:complete len:321 (-) Transcript_22396:582-1544(-)